MTPNRSPNSGLPPSRSPAIAWRRKSGQLLRLEELPIPDDVVPGQGWTGQMREMADHIGAPATLRVIVAHGGEIVSIPSSADASPFLNVLTPQQCAVVANVYGGCQLHVPVGRTAVARARRAVVIAAVRAAHLTGAEAQKIIGTSRNYVSHLVHHTTEGTDPASLATIRDSTQGADMFLRAEGRGGMSGPANASNAEGGQVFGDA